MYRTAAPKGKIIVSGILFWYPLAGVTYQFLHYLIGLRRLGYDVYYIEDSARWVYDPRLNDLSPNPIGNIAMVVPILERHGFREHWAFRGRYPGGACYGMNKEEILQLYRDADALLNVTGGQELIEDQIGKMRLVYVESDPFALQVEIARGDQNAIASTAQYDALFSFGENLGSQDCDVPVERFKWMPTRQPVVLDLWDNPFPGGRQYRTVTTWSNSGSEVIYKGETYYWTKDREFEKFLDLPLLSSAQFEMAVGVEPAIRDKLLSKKWGQVDSIEISRNIESYRTYIQKSRGEFTVARDQYVRPRTGWFSDRSACYLAAGRPVITQETGFSKFMPVGKGLFAFNTIEDILNAVDAIESGYEANCRAARDIAAEYFDAEKVIGSLMERARL